MRRHMTKFRVLLVVALLINYLNMCNVSLSYLEKRKHMQLLNLRFVCVF